MDSNSYIKNCHCYYLIDNTVIQIPPMANPEESFKHELVKFRAPPPSPVASGRRSSVANDEILTEFLHHSLRVPDLVLPDQLSTRQKSKIQNLPKLDYKLLNSLENQHMTNIFDSIARTGCFELFNHGISDHLVRSVANYGAGLFELSPEKKAGMCRSGNKLYGFVEFEEKEISEEFVWCTDNELKSKLEAILPLHYSNSSENLEILTSEIEKISEIILKFLHKNTTRRTVSDDDEAREKQIGGSICYLYRHHQDLNTTRNDDENTTASLRYDMIRMLIRGSEHSHTLCLHVCNGSEFHVYSKKGWVSFCPEKDALVITIGDRLQKWSEGKFKHVMGRPVSKGGEDYISMAFMYNPPLTSMKKKTISIGHQALLFFILALFFKFCCN